MYMNHSIPVKIGYDLCNPCFECLWITLRPKWLPRSISKIAAACVYLPPNLMSNNLDKFYDYSYYCYDKPSSESSDTAFIVARDFNPSSSGFQQKYLTKYCNIKQDTNRKRTS